MKELYKMPFLRLLLPLLLGILIQYYYSISSLSILFFAAGIVLMLVSYLLPPQKQFGLRWLFGCGVYLSIFSVGILSTFNQQCRSVLVFQATNKSYRGTVIDLPQAKPQTIALKVQLDEPHKKVICYLPKDSASLNLNAGDRIEFFSKIERFSSVKLSTGFDYARYMYNKGFAGSTFVHNSYWEKLSETDNSVLIKAAQYRQKTVQFIKTLGLDSEQSALMSALLLGYTDDLSDELKEGFRTTGSAHVLSVSGMHVAIIYGVIVLLFGFVSRHSRFAFLKQFAILFILWAYLFLIGLPPSALRAGIMLSVFCIAAILKVKSFTLNTLFAAAFIILLFDPLSFFDIGFQMSFSAVLSMCLLLPVFSIEIRSRILRYPVNLLMISVAAQIGTFPLAIYYFGTFPSYFFITNLFIVPLVSLLFYNGLLVLVTGVLGVGGLFVMLFRFFTELLLRIISFFEKLPFAIISDIDIYIWEVFVLWVVVFGLIYFFRKKHPKVLQISLIGLLLLILSGIYSRVEKRNSLWVYSDSQSGKVTYYTGYKSSVVNVLAGNELLNLNDVRYLILHSDNWKGQQFSEKFDVDYLHLTGKEQMSLYVLNDMFRPRKVVLDATLPRKNLKRYVTECEKLRIPYYDVSNNGTLRINF